MTIPRTHWLMIALLWVTGLLAAAQFAKLTLTLGSMVQVYPHAPVAWAVSGTAVIGILGGAFVGSLVAKIGARQSVLLAVILSVIVSLIQGVEMPFAVFMITRLFEGAGHLLLVVALPTMMVALARSADRSVVMGIWGTFFGVGFALLALVIPSIESAYGVRAVYVGHGVLFLLLFPVLYRCLPTVMTGDGAMPNIVTLHLAIYSNPREFAPSLGHGIYTLIFIALVAFLPATLGAAWLAVILPLSNLSGTFVSGFIARRVAASHLSVACFGISGVLFLLLGLTGAIWVAVLALFFTGLTAGANFAAVPEFNTTPEAQARANGAMAQIGNIGTFSGTPIFAMVAGNLWGIVAVSIVICGAGVVFAGWAYHAARQRRDMSAVIG